MKHQRRLVGLLEQQLLQDIEDNSEQDKGGEAGGDKDREGRIRGESAQWAGDVSEYTHSGQRSVEGMQRREHDVVGGRVGIDIFLWSCSAHQ